MHTRPAAAYTQRIKANLALSLGDSFHCVSMISIKQLHDIIAIVQVSYCHQVQYFNLLLHIVNYWCHNLQG